MSLLVTVDCFRFSVDWFGGVGPVSFRLHQILPQRVSCSGFGGAGFEALGSAVSVWQLPDSGSIRYTVRMLEPTSVTKTAEPAIAKPNAGKAAGSFAALSNRRSNLPIR